MNKNKNKINESNLNLDLDLVSFLDPIVCKVEIDIAGWLFDLSGGDGWKLHSEQENENYTSFFLKQGEQQAEVTLYHSGFAQVDIDDQLVFHGDMLEKSCKKAKLNYYRVDNGDKILLN
tara:strand:+ start:2063 stop:2419 length:357 start_codon:yes stop_codon:yes gene_type:complete